MKVFAVALAALALTPVAAATEEATWQEEIAALKSEVAELKEMLYAGRGLGRRQQPGAGLARDRRRMKQDRRRLAAAHDNDRRSLKNKDGSDELGEAFSMVKYMKEAMAANTTIFDTLEDHAGVLEDHTEVLSVVDDTLGEIDSTNTTLFATLSDHAAALDDIDATNTTLFAALSGQADLLSTQASLLQDHADALDDIDDTNTTLFATLSEQADLLSTQASLLQDHADALDDIDDTNVTVFGAIDDFEDRIADEEAATAAADCIVYTACGAE